MNNSWYILIIELIGYITFWWFGIYLAFTKKHIKSIILLTVFFLGVSTFFIADLLAYTSPSLDINVWIIRLSDPAIYFTVTLFLHLILIELNRNRPVKEKVLLTIAYSGAIIFSFLSIFTNLVVDTTIVAVKETDTTWTFAAGKLNSLVVSWQMAILLITATKAYKLYKDCNKDDKAKYLLPFIAILLFFSAGIVVQYNYYLEYLALIGFIFNSLVGLGALLIILSIVLMGLFLDEPLIKSKHFQISSLAMLPIIVIYLLVLVATGLPTNYHFIVLSLTLVPLLITSHYAFDWINDLSRNIVLQNKWQFSKIPDSQIADALRHYQKPSSLEDSPLLELKIVAQAIKDGRAKNKIDALRLNIKETVEYFAPDPSDRQRTRQNIKYHLLKMIAFDQVEEGQILWELGFSDYPVRVMAMESSQHTPKLKIKSPADYSSTSRNVYFSLKQEAIHDVAWRLSYLEQLATKGKGINHAE